MTRRFEPYGYMSSNLRGIFLSQQNVSWPACGRWSQHLTQGSREGSWGGPRGGGGLGGGGVRPVSATTVRLEALQSEWHVPNTMWALLPRDWADQPVSMIRSKSLTCKIEKY